MDCIAPDALWLASGVCHNSTACPSQQLALNLSSKTYECNLPSEERMQHQPYENWTQKKFHGEHLNNKNTDRIVEQTLPTAQLRKIQFEDLDFGICFPWYIFLSD